SGGEPGGSGGAGGVEPPCPDADRDGLCDADDGECNVDGQPVLCDALQPDCADGTVPEVRGGCYTGACVTWATCGGAPPPPPDACTPVEPGEFGDCRALIGWASNGDGTCGMVSGCGCDERCEGRVFDSEAACLAACAEVPPPPPQFCGGFAGLPCPAGEICIDDPTDDCDPAAGGADCGGICVPDGCPDADRDGRCDDVDPDCNADGSLLMCRRAPPDCPRGTVPEVREGCYTNACVTWAECGGGVVDACGLPADAGDCDAAIRRWYHDAASGLCLPFVYGGCGGNANNFETIEACEAACGGGAMCVREPSVSPRDPLFDRYEGTGFANDCRSDDDCFRGGCSGEVCSASPDVASTCEVVPMPEGACGCVAGQCQWYVDSCNGGCADVDRDGLCDADDFECNADGNPSLCDRIPPRCPAGTVAEVLNGCYTDRCVTWAECGAPAPDACGLPADPGPCEAAIPRWYHDAATGACQPFIYGGCAGNANNFETLEDCQASCGACRDADADGTCDAADANCNADGSLLMCRRVAPNCPRGTVPEVREGCYTDVCVTWAECGGAAPPPAPCEPVREGEYGLCDAVLGFGVGADGTCGVVSGCGCDETCRGRVFETAELCDATCGACPDADGDRICDADDAECNVDGQPAMCFRLPPACRAGTVPEVVDGCYTDACVTWAACGAPAVDLCGLPADPGLCNAAFRRFYFNPATGTCEGFVWGGCGGNENNFETLEACEAACGGAVPPGVGQACGGFAGFACPDRLVCVDAPNDGCDPRNGGADCPGVCALP
ncbi:BPTI/Kunitz-type proteinase inhibitor domain-containing protein, partial [Myxococcota bacterium]|nr:BPTI/Kunitz-type proteinase inhibitor domain-containing protein [Myxococcota bacterium]